jgi:hypothetical protein
LRESARASRNATGKSCRAELADILSNLWILSKAETMIQSVLPSWSGCSYLIRERDSFGARSLFAMSANAKVRKFFVNTKIQRRVSYFFTICVFLRAVVF